MTWMTDWHGHAVDELESLFNHGSSLPRIQELYLLRTRLILQSFQLEGIHQLWHLHRLHR
jgi:hypothetical protein